MSILVIIITFLISIFGFSQILGSLIYKIFKEKQYKYFITIIIWAILLFAFYLIINLWFKEYFNYYLGASIVGAIVSFFAVRKDS